MNSKIKIILLLSLLACTKSIFGQADFTTFINDRVKSLAKSDADTVIKYYAFANYLKEDTIKGLGNIQIMQSALLVYRDKSIWKAEKYLYYFKNTDNPKLAQSKTLEFKTDSNYSKLLLLLPKIEMQGFQPYIYRDSSKGIESYYIGSMTHTPIYDITVQTKSYYRSYNIDELTLHEKFLYVDEGPINLNYKYNTSLELYSFFTIIKQLSLTLDSKF